jgi:choline dehydrogenase-like flavoprotein
VTQGWDYLIAGGGSAGAVLAARLSEDPSASVLVLDAGPDFRSADTPSAFRTRKLDMNVEHNPDFWWPGLVARRNPAQQPTPYLRGRGLGGTSTVNALCAIRGVPDDFDRWAARGVTGWSYREILPAFIKLEDDHDFPDAPYHGRGGPMPIYREPPEGWGGVDHAFREAALDAGYPWHEDHNAPGSTGLSPYAMNIRDGRRVSSNDGYLEPARGRPNLTIRGGARVDRVELGPTHRATGVRLVGGEVLHVNPGGEVIVSAGSVHSPAVLMRSGIGPAADLAGLGIDVVADLPVGRGMQDHAMVIIPLPTVEAARHSPHHRVTNCIVRYSSRLAGAGVNDMMLLPNNFWMGSSLLIAHQEQAIGRGTVTLASRDPLVEPVIDHRLLTDPGDLARMVDAMERLRELASHRAFTSILEGRPEFPGPDDLPRVVTDAGHMSSSCPMGGPGDEAAVVDPDCRVLGVEGLRVIDGSVMPYVVRANLLLSVLAVAEHMADRIRAVVPQTAVETTR